MLKLQPKQPFGPNNINLLREAVRRALESGMMTAELPLNEPQREALEAYSVFLNQSDDAQRAYADMATGTGKTGLFSVIIRHLYRILDERGLRDDFKTVIVEPTLPLIRQTRKGVLAVGPELESMIGVYGGGSKQLDKPISIMTYDAWLSLIESGRLTGDNIGFHVTDEAHYALSDRRRDFFDEDEGVLANTVHFGVTATAQYDLERSLAHTHKNLIYRLPQREAIERGFSADYVHVQYAVMRLLPSAANVEGAELSNADYTFLKRLEWARLVTHAYANEKDTVSGQDLSDKIGIIFAADTKHADQIADLMNKNPKLKEKAKRLGFEGVAVSIHSMGMSTSVQDRLQEDFEAGKYMLAVGDKKFKVGFDYSRIKFEASYPGSSVVDIVQEIGRATRQYFDPMTGEPMGTVIFEAIPYIGDNDPEKDAKARKAALAKCVTAYEVLGDTLIYGKGSTRKSVRKPKPKSFGITSPEAIDLSPGCTVELYLTEIDTLTISRQIDSARIVEERIEITPEMLVDFRKKVRERGIGSRQLFNKIAEYEADTGVAPIGINGSLIELLLSSMPETFSLPKWQRINEVLDTIPYSGISERVELTPEMAKALKAKILSRGSLSSKSIYDLIQRNYSVDRGLISDITEGSVKSLVEARTKTVSRKILDLVNQILDGLPTGKPEQVSSNILITPAIINNLKQIIDNHGGLAPHRLGQKVSDYEARNNLASIGLDHNKIYKILKGKKKQIDEASWLRLNDVIKGLPKSSARKRIKITKGMIEELNRKRTINGVVLGETRLPAKIREFEKQNGLQTTGFSAKTLEGMISGRIQSIDEDQWFRVNEALDSLAPASMKSEKRRKQPSEASNKSIDDLIAEKLATSLSGLTDDLVTRVADAVFARLNVNLTAPPEDKPAPRRRKSRKPDDYADLKPVIESVAAPAEPKAVEAIAMNPPERIQAYDLPLFNKPDARGDSMLSCLCFAERAAEISDHVGAKSNLRKFVETAIHATLLNITAEPFIEPLQLKTSEVEALLAIGRRYGHMCAKAADPEAPQRRGATAKGERVELTDRLQLLYESMRILGKADRVRFSSRIYEAARNIVVDAGDIHHHLRHKETRPVADAMENGYYLADWMKAEFGSPRPAIVQVQSSQVAEPVADEQPTLPKLSPSILKVLDITAELSEADIDAASYVSELAARWAQEPATRKAQNNRSIQYAYAAVKPGIEAMLAVGATVSQMAAELNKQAPASFEWSAETILRGAVLTLSKLPLSAFDVNKPKRREGPAAGLSTPTPH